MRLDSAETEIDLRDGVVTDDVLVGRYRAGDAAALDMLFQRYRALARAKARGYFIVGGDSDDIEQEGMIGLYKAVRDYQPDREAGFRAFADLCVTRQVLSAVKGANRHKHQPMHRYVSISGSQGAEGEDVGSVDHLLDDHHVVDPADEVCRRDGMDALHRGLGDLLSGLEAEVLRMYVDGRSYQEIGEILGRHVKSIDNALQRIKRKVEFHVAERDAAERAEEACLAAAS